MSKVIENYLYHTAYLAPVNLYQVLCSENKLYIDDKEYFDKSSFRNRCQILTANGTMELIIPVVKGASSQTLIKDVRIAEHDNWQLRHWRSIKAAYSSSPFFEYYEDDFLPFYTQKWDFLWDFNVELERLILSLLSIEKSPVYSGFEQINIVDLKSQIHPKSLEVGFYLSNQFSENLKPYYQVFDRKFGFKPNLSIVDMLFNLGPESILYLT